MKNELREPTEAAKRSIKIKVSGLVLKMVSKTKPETDGDFQTYADNLFKSRSKLIDEANNVLTRELYKGWLRERDLTDTIEQLKKQIK